MTEGKFKPKEPVPNSMLQDLLDLIRELEKRPRPYYMQWYDVVDGKLYLVTYTPDIPWRKKYFGKLSGYYWRLWRIPLRKLITGLHRWWDKRK